MEVVVLDSVIVLVLELDVTVAPTIPFDPPRLDDDIARWPWDEQRNTFKQETGSDVEELL